MLLAGDEVLRTQQGNNNAYCQDNGLGWFDWSLLEKNADMLRFVSGLIAFRKRHPCLMRRRFLAGTRREGCRLPDITWHGTRLDDPLWDDPDARLLAYTLGAAVEDEEDLHVILNMSVNGLDLPLPRLAGREWHRAIDTGAPAPADIVEAEDQTGLGKDICVVRPRSVVVLESRAVPSG